MRAASSRLTQMRRERRGFHSLAGNASGLFGFNEGSAGGINATCEMARELIKTDTTDATDAEGIQSVGITGGLYIQFDKRDQEPKVTETARLYLAKLGNYLARKSGVAKLVRV